MGSSSGTRVSAWPSSRVNASIRPGRTVNSAWLSRGTSARANDYPAKARRGIVLAAITTYRRAMRDFADMDALSVWYAHADMAQVQHAVSGTLRAGRRKALARTIAKARTKDNLGALDLSLIHI